jgi:hypothetical protein
MSEPVRLVCGSASQGVREILRGARVDAPPGLKERALSAALHAYAAGGAAAGGSAAGAVKGALANVHWVGVAGVVGVCVAAGAMATRAEPAHDVATAPSMETAKPRPPHPSTAPAAAPSTQAAVGAPSSDWATVVDVSDLPEAPAAASAPVGEPPAARHPTASGHAAPPPAPSAQPSPDVDDLGPTGPNIYSEVAWLDQVRKELAAGDGRDALSLLRSYDARFQDGALRSEAVVLRIEALAVTGQRAEAASLGHAVIARDPDGPYVTRIRTLLGEPSP